MLFLFSVRCILKKVLQLIQLIVLGFFVVVVVLIMFPLTKQIIKSRKELLRLQEAV